MNRTTSDIQISTGVRLQYVEAGPATGAPVVMLHGYSDSWYSFAAMQDAVGERAHSFALTQRGHGDADRPDAGYAMADFAADVVAFLDARKLERVAIAAHSMGTFIAQEVALAHPDRVSHLVLIGSAPRGENPVIAELGEFVAGLTDPVDREFIREFQASTVHAPLADEVLDTIIGESAKLPARIWRQALDGLRAYDASARLAEISAPTLVLWGDRDTVFSRAEQDEILAKMPAAKLSVYDDVGHGLHWEQPGRSADDLVEFIGR